MNAGPNDIAPCYVSRISRAYPGIQWPLNPILDGQSFLTFPTVKEILYEKVHMEFEKYSKRSSCYVKYSFVLSVIASLGSPGVAAS